MGTDIVLHIDKGGFKEYFSTSFSAMMVEAYSRLVN